MSIVELTLLNNQNSHREWFADNFDFNTVDYEFNVSLELGDSVILRNQEITKVFVMTEMGLVGGIYTLSPEIT